MKFLTKLLKPISYVKDINSSLTENDWEIRQLKSKISDNHTYISNMQVAITQILTRIKKLEKLEEESTTDTLKIQSVILGSLDKIKSLSQYTEILSRRISKLQGKENEKKDNSTGQEDINL